jgi:hypothetical protein
MTISRRHLVTAASVAAGTIGSAFLSGNASAGIPSKAPKSAVGYQSAPRDDQSCGLCANYLPPTDCKVVASPVTPNAWCRLFVPRSSGG